jgi:hypothetical protein
MIKNGIKIPNFPQNENLNKTNENINDNKLNNSDFSLNKDNNKMKQLIEEYKKEIINLKEFSKFNEENYEEQINIIKKQNSNFISENIVLKTSNDKLKMEINYKDKELEKYKSIIQNYKKLLNSEEEDKNDINNIININTDNNQNDLLFLSQIEKLKTDNLLLLNDLKKEQSEHNDTKKNLNHYKESASLYKKKLKKKNMKIISLKRKIKNLKKDPLKFNAINNNKDCSIMSGSFSSQSKINLNTDNLSNYFSNYSFNSNFNNNHNNSVNENFMRKINILVGENNFLRKELQKAKNRIYELNLKMQVYESQEEDNLKNNQKLQNIQDNLNDITNQKIDLINYINGQIKELNETNKNSNIKFDIINLTNNYNNINSLSLNDISIFFKYIFNKILSLCYEMDIYKKKEKKYLKEIKDSEIENQILLDQIKEQQCDNEAYKETIKIYENNLKKLNSEKAELNNIIKNYKSKK